MAEIRILKDGRAFILTNKRVDNNSNNLEQIYEARNMLNPHELLYWHKVQKVSLDKYLSDKFNDIITNELYGDNLLDGWNEDTANDTLKHFIYNFITLNNNSLTKKIIDDYINNAKSKK